MTETKTVYVAYTNSDCTEGRGYDIPIAICELEITAMKHARHSYVQGSDGPVRAIELVKIDNKWYYPSHAVNVLTPTEAEIQAQKVLDAKREVIKKMKAAGLTDTEINTIQAKL